MPSLKARPCVLGLLFGLRVVFPAPGSIVGRRSHYKRLPGRSNRLISAPGTQHVGLPPGASWSIHLQPSHAKTVEVDRGRGGGVGPPLRTRVRYVRTPTSLGPGRFVCAPVPGRLRRHLELRGSMRAPERSSMEQATGRRSGRPVSYFDWPKSSSLSMVAAFQRFGAIGGGRLTGRSPFW